MILFGSTLSPYVRKVAVYAAEKGLELELQPAGLGQGGPDFKAASPFGKMPGFKDDDFLISDSTAIITYLEAKFPEPNLIPLEPRARARAIWYEELADTIVMAAGVPQGPLIGKILAEVEEWWIDSDFIDDEFSLAERLKAVVQATI